MGVLKRLLRSWPALLAGVAALGALALLWSVRDTPLQPALPLRIDALSAFFGFATLAGLALVLAVWPPAGRSVLWRLPVAIVALLVAYFTTLIPLIVGMYLLVAVLTLPALPGIPQAPASGRFADLRLALGMSGRVLPAAPGLLASGCLLAGYGALVVRGVLRYDDRSAGIALDSFAFWFVLLAALVPISTLAASDDRRPTTDDRRPTTKNQEPPRGYPTENQPSWLENRGLKIEDGSLDPSEMRSSILDPLSSSGVGSRWSVVSGQWSMALDLVRIAWLYPLARLYSLGPWNNGWLFATLLLGGAVALWSAGSTLMHPDAGARAGRGLPGYLGLALAGFGLGTGAGVAAGCYALLAYLVLVIGRATEDTASQSLISNPATKLRTGLQSPISSLRWLLSGAIPLTAPFVAAWMLVGAAAGGGVMLLAGAAWLVTLLNGLSTALWAAEIQPYQRRSLILAAGASVLLGCAAPLVVRGLIEPVVIQLQGGLTPYGDFNVWPWVGLAAIDSARTQVTTLPSVVIVGLMLVLSALVYLVARLRADLAADRPVPGAATPGTDAGLAGTPHGLNALIRQLRGEVPWLGDEAAPEPGEEQRRDGG